jgi:hypothetical protein
MTGSSPEDPSPERNEVWAEVRGKSVHGTYSVSGGWVEVVADNGQYRTAQIGESSIDEVAQRLLYELHARGSGAVDE